MLINLVGSGNVATHLGRILKQKGHTISVVCSKNIENAQILANELNAQATNQLRNILPTADLTILAIKDDLIQSLTELVKTSGIVVHTSGSVSMDALSNHLKYGVFYPLQTFSKNRNVNFSSIPMCIEASSPEVYDVLSQLAAEISEMVYPISSNQRAKLHLAAVFACNFVNHLYALSEVITQQHQVSFDVLKPLILETAQKAIERSPHLVQTGPAIRGDQKVLKHHLAQLENSPELAHVYKVLSDSIQHFHANKS